MKILLLTAAIVAAANSSAFDVIGLVDSLDYATVYDIETQRGNVQTIDYIAHHHVTDIWWRDKGGGKVRYPSPTERNPPNEAPFNKFALPTENIWGYLRMDAPQYYMFDLVRKECARRGLRFGIHTTSEENHYSPTSCSSWTVMHPQFWACERGGVPFQGQLSFGYRETIEHKLELLDERLKMSPKTVFLDVSRNGTWTPAMEYTRPNIEEWRRRYGCEPPADWHDRRWMNLIAEKLENYYRQYSAKCHAVGVKFILGSYGIDGNCDIEVMARVGADWVKLAADGVIDGFVVMSLQLDRKDPFGSTERIYRKVMSKRGKTDIYFPLSAYNFRKTSIAEYAKLSGLSRGEAARRLIRMAKDCGGRGIVMECIDEGSYKPDEIAAIRDLAK